MTVVRTQSLPQGQSVFDDLREGFAFVHENARHVRIDGARLAAYAAALPGRPPGNVLDVTHHYIGPHAETAAYILTLDAINFGSGYQPMLVREGWRLEQGSLYFTLSTRLKEYFERRGPLPAERLAVMAPGDVAALLALPAGVAGGRFAAQCARNLQGLGMFVANKHGGFLEMVDACEGRAENLVRALAGLESFDDVHAYRGREIAFYKRAQITAADLHLAFKRLGRELFTDIGSLTMFPDNGVPHVLRTDGVLEYTPALAARIAAGEEIVSGSEEEVEIRASAAHAVELIAAAKGLRAMDIDHILWHRSVEDARYLEEPTHRTVSVYY